MDFFKFQQELKGRFFYRYDLRSESFTFKCPSTAIEVVLAKKSIKGFEVEETKEDYTIFLDLVENKTLILGKKEIHFPFSAENLFLEDDFNYSTTDDLKEGILKFIANKDYMEEGEIIYQIEFHGAIIESAIQLGFKINHYRYLIKLIKEVCLFND